jgi:hypothetical protein
VNALDTCPNNRRDRTSDYFANVVPQDKFAETLESNLMPLNKEVYEKNDFEVFLKYRSQRVLEFLDKQMV